MFSDRTLKSIEQHVDAIGLCMLSRLILPALTLVYVGIDTFGALGRPVGQARKGREDFIAWADRYMVIPKQLSVTGRELYGARCGILHTLGPESNLSTSGFVRPILYAWGNRDAGSGNDVLARFPELPAVVAKAEDIADAFVEGIVAF